MLHKISRLKTLPAASTTRFLPIKVSHRNYSLVSLGQRTEILFKQRNTVGLKHCRTISVQGIVDGYTSFFQSISESKAAEKTEQILVTIHETTGLPWWGSIILTTVCARLCVTVPLSIYQSYVLAKLELCKLEMNELVKELKKETGMAIRMFNWTQNEAKFAYNISAKKQWRLLIEKHNCHPMKATLVFWFQFPMWVLLSCTLRNMVYSPKLTIDAQVMAFEFQAGGVFWAPNLFLPDSTLILPITLGIVNLLIIELQVLSRLKEPTKFHKILSNMFRFIAVIMVPVAASVPSCLSLYWVSSSIFGLVQNFTLLSPRVKRLVGIPKLSTEVNHPYKLVLNSFKKRWYFFNLFK